MTARKRSQASSYRNFIAELHRVYTVAQQVVRSAVTDLNSNSRIATPYFAYGLGSFRYVDTRRAFGLFIAPLSFFPRSRYYPLYYPLLRVLPFLFHSRPIILYRSEPATLHRNLHRNLFRTFPPPPLFSPPGSGDIAIIIYSATFSAIYSAISKAHL